MLENVVNKRAESSVLGRILFQNRNPMVTAMKYKHCQAMMLQHDDMPLQYIFKTGISEYGQTLTSSFNRINEPIQILAILKGRSEHVTVFHLCKR